MDKSKILTNLERKTDRFVFSARELSSRGFSFIIVMLGVVLQASHTTLLMYEVSGFENVYLKFAVALGIGVFLSSALAIFTLKHNDRDNNMYSIINVFYYFDIFSNAMYFFNTMIFNYIEYHNGISVAEVPIKNWFYLFISLPFSFMMPFAIKKFAGIIATDHKLKMGSIENEEDIIKLEDVNKIITNKVNEISNDRLETLVSDSVKESFENFELPEVKDGLSKEEVSEITNNIVSDSIKEAFENFELPEVKDGLSKEEISEITKNLVSENLKEVKKGIVNKESLSKIEERIRHKITTSLKEENIIKMIKEEMKPVVKMINDGLENTVKIGDNINLKANGEKQKVTVTK